MNYHQATSLLRRLRGQRECPSKWDVRVAEVCADYLDSEYYREMLRAIRARCSDNQTEEEKR